MLTYLICPSVQTFFIDCRKQEPGGPGSYITEEGLKIQVLKSRGFYCVTIIASMETGFYILRALAGYC